jgi:hypothetical protein
MPRIEPIPLEELAEEPRRIIEEGVADGTYATPVPLQIFAYKTMQILMTNAAAAPWGKQSLLGAGSSSSSGSAAPSSASASPACSRASTTPSPTRTWPASSPPATSQLTEQERLAVQFLDLLSADHHAIDDEFYRELGQVFTAAQIVELGFTCANTMGSTASSTPSTSSARALRSSPTAPTRSTPPTPTSPEQAPA